MFVSFSVLVYTIFIGRYYWNCKLMTKVKQDIQLFVVKHDDFTNFHGNSLQCTHTRTHMHYQTKKTSMSVFSLAALVNVNINVIRFSQITELLIYKMAHVKESIEFGGRKCVTHLC